MKKEVNENLSILLQKFYFIITIEI